MMDDGSKTSQTNNCALQPPLQQNTLQHVNVQNHDVPLYTPTCSWNPICETYVIAIFGEVYYRLCSLLLLSVKHYNFAIITTFYMQHYVNLFCI